MRHVAKVGGFPLNPKRRLLGAVPIKSIVRFGVGWDWLGHVPDSTLARFCYPCAGHSSTTTTHDGTNEIGYRRDQQD